MAGNKSTTANVDRQSGYMTLHHQETDSPILPIAHIEKLQSFRPDIVDFIVNETGQEGATRRAEQLRHNTFVFIERILGQLIAAGVCCATLYAAYQTALAGHDWPAAVIGSTAVIGLAAAFLNGRRR